MLRLLQTVCHPPENKFQPLTPLPLPLGISNNLLWEYGYFLQLENYKLKSMCPDLVKSYFYSLFLQPDGTDLFNFIDGHQSWADYLRNMEQDGTWGDHIILYGTANCYDTYIEVISSQSNHRDLTIRPDGHVMSTNPLVLGHVHEVHYVSLKPKQGKA